MNAATAPHRITVTASGGTRTASVEILGVRVCPRRGVRIVVREWTDDGPFPYPTRIAPSDVRLTGKQRAHLLATDERGALIRPGLPARALTRMGLTEPHGFGWRLTEAGRAVAEHLRGEHRTRVSELGGERHFNMARNRWELHRDRYAWTCTCGTGSRQLGAQEARLSARRHRETGWAPTIIPAATAGSVPPPITRPWWG